MTQSKKLYKIPEQGMVSGVCAGLSEYFDMDVTIVRLLWVLATFIGGSGILAYIICAIVIPKKTDVIDNNNFY
ncbi:PspC family transcriptional regulator [Clostridium polyendosporum]|uniref:PspC family transcriptional regulator n=1 Tax=Clostridium polyendosporum TaxID=69208 RepID=A0A919VFI1_9CLOT|nr:PspC domain-containing protein [Clostridium polyendosporum]GIM27526.1 PspC family transcriptional regulator [Clostridium polyendosporum]